MIKVEQDGGTLGIAGLSTPSYAGQGGTQTAGGATATDRGEQSGSFGKGGNLTKAQTGGGRRAEAGLEEELLLGKEADGGSGWVFTEANYIAGYTSSTYTGGTWLLGSQYYLANENTVAGNITNGIPTYNGTGTMTGNSGNGYIKITLIEPEYPLSPSFIPMQINVTAQPNISIQNEDAITNLDNLAGEEIQETKNNIPNIEKIEEPEAVIPNIKENEYLEVTTTNTE